MEPEDRWPAKAAEGLRRLALDETAKMYVLQNCELYRFLYPAVTRFIGGETLDDCVRTARSLNEEGHACTIDYMGESTRDVAQAGQVAREFLRVVRAIEISNLQASVSLDLSHLGLLIDEHLCFESASAVATAAGDGGIEVMISAEGVERTHAVLDLHRRLGARFPNVGITIQAFLHDSPRILADVLKGPGKIRVVKGAFGAPEGVVMPRGDALNRAFVALVLEVLDHGRACSIATHDPILLESLTAVAEERGGDDRLLEFEMLKGVAQERIDALRDRGHPTRVYLPYGREWHLYLCNRLAEFPPNVFRAIADVTRRSVER